MGDRGGKYLACSSFLLVFRVRSPQVDSARVSQADKARGSEIVESTTGQSYVGPNGER